MNTRVLGRTGLKVSEIGFGGWAIGGNAFGNSYGPPIVLLMSTCRANTRQSVVAAIHSHAPHAASTPPWSSLTEPPSDAVDTA